MTFTIQGRHGLEGDERAAAEALIAACQVDDQSELLVSLDPSAAHPHFNDQFVCYEQGALIGLAALQHGPEVEIALMVHPQQRRRGVGRALLKAAQAEAEQRGLAALLVCDERVAAGKAFVAALGLPLHHAEYRMQLDQAALGPARAPHPGLRMRAADQRDQATLEWLQSAAFGDTAAEAHEYMSDGLNDPTRQYFIAELEEQPVGLLRLGRYATFADITAFGVLAEQRGRGYGRQMLREAVDILVAEQWQEIMIEVFVENENALGLYQSCGFRTIAKYGYYHEGHE